MQFKSIKLKNTREVLNHTLHHIGGKVLDLGAGGAKYKGLILKRAEEYRACDAIKNESIDDICDVLNLKYPEEHFDTIVSTQVIEHIPNPYRMVSQIRKVLKVGGKAILTAPFLVPMHSDPDDYFRFTKDGLSEIFKQAGFEILESGHYGGFFIVMSEIIHFSWFNPYKYHKTRISRWGAGGGRIMKLIEKIATFFDRFIPTKSIFAGSYIVVRKLK